MGLRTTGRGVAAAAVLLVAACGPVVPEPVPSPTPTASPSPVATTPPPVVPLAPLAPGAGVVRDSGAPLADRARLGHDAGSLLPVDGGALQVTDAPDGSTRQTVTGPDGTLAWVAPPRGGRAEVQVDGSLTLHDDAGTVVAALGAPADADGGRGTWRPDGDVLALDAPTGSASFVVGTAAVDAATWTEEDDGRSLRVVPAGWVRTGPLAAQHALVSQLEAVEPESASPSMRAQLWCHVLGAPDKASWDLEPWRPDVSTATMLLTRCNPTDVDV